jgi:predicted acetyltransferase
MTLKNVSLTSLSQNPEYFEDVIRLIESEFHYSDKNHFEKDFAPLINPLNFENCFVYVDQETNTVVAHLAVCVRSLVKSKNEMKVALLGGIVTHKDYRGQKLFKQLLEHAIQTYKNDVSLFILWSDLEGIYEKFNFYRTGGLIETGKQNLNSSERPAGYEKHKFSTLNDTDLHCMINLYTSFNEENFFTLKRTDKDWSIIKEMDSVDLYIKRNSTNEIIKYFCVNKGQDLQNIIHEFSCSNQNEYMAFLKDIKSFRAWLPETELPHFPNAEIFYNAYIKLADTSLLSNFLSKISDNELHIDQFINEIVHFSFQGETHTVSSKDFLQYIFGPRPLAEFSKYNLSLYVCGLDSI